MKSSRRHPHAPLHPLESRRLFSTTLHVSNPTPSESDKFATFDLTLSAPLAAPLTLRYATQAITATPGKDFTPKSGTLTLPASSTSATIKIPLLEDNRIETDETFRLLLGSLPPGLKLAKPFATATITDDEPLPTFDFSSPTVTEGSDPKSPRTATVTVSLLTLGPTLPSDVPLTLHYATADSAGHFGSATAKSDYTPVSGTLTFRPGQTKQTISVPIRPDKLNEGNESFQIVYSRPTGAALPLSLFVAAVDGSTLPSKPVGSTITIKDDDAPTGLPVLQLPAADPATNPPAVTFSLNAQDPTASADLTITLPAPVDHDVTVHYAYPAEPSPGIIPAAGTLTIPAGQTAATLTLTADTATAPNDGSGSFTFNYSSLSLLLSHPTGASLPGNVPSLRYDLPVTFYRSPVLSLATMAIDASLGAVYTSHLSAVAAAPTYYNYINTTAVGGSFAYDPALYATTLPQLTNGFLSLNTGATYTGTTYVGGGTLLVNSGSNALLLPYTGASGQTLPSNGTFFAGGTINLGSTSPTNSGQSTLILQGTSGLIRTIVLPPSTTPTDPSTGSVVLVATPPPAELTPDTPPLPPSDLSTLLTTTP